MENGFEQNMSPSQQPSGKNYAIASMVLGIVGCVFLFTGDDAGWLISLVCSIIGLVMASNAKKAGYQSGMRTAGFVLSLIALILVGLCVFLVVVGFIMLMMFGIALFA